MRSSKFPFVFTVVSSLALAATASAVSVLSSDFTGVNTSGTTATGIAWTTNGIQTPATSLEFYSPSAPATKFGFHAGGTPANNIQVARNIETLGPWATSFAFTTTTGIDLVSFALDYRAINNSGIDQNTGTARSAIYTLEIFSGTTSLGSFFDTVTDSGPANDRAVIDLSSLDPLAADTNYRFVLTVSSTATAGNNVAIDNLDLTGTLIPEPSFALLGLSGAVLLLRRRLA